MLGRRRTLSTASAWGDLIGAFGGKRLGEDDGGTERTRFNNVGRALSSRDRIRTAFDGALALDVTEGAILTATTDPSCFPSIAGAAEDLVGKGSDVSALRRWLDRPPSFAVIEPTAVGVPHAHVPVFADPDTLPTRHDLQGYWHVHRERAQQVHVATIKAAGDTWRWAGEGPEDADGCPPETYLSTGAEALATVADLSAEDVLAVAEAYRSRDVEDLDRDAVDDLDASITAETPVSAEAVREAAWYWATGLSTSTTPSPALRGGS
jgi:hypothetical protein